MNNTSFYWWRKKKKVKELCFSKNSFFLTLMFWNTKKCLCVCIVKGKISWTLNKLNVRWRFFHQMISQNLTQKAFFFLLKISQSNLETSPGLCSNDSRDGFIRLRGPTICALISVFRLLCLGFSDSAKNMNLKKNQMWHLIKLLMTLIH